jgi:parallel beta-helix repeat protein
VPTATPKPTPAPTSSTSGPITVTSDNVTIDGVTITSSGISGAGISATGTVSNPISNLTIRNCTIKGFRLGIYLRFVKNVTIENCTITDADYAGIAIFSGIGGRISGNTILRIGMTKDPATGFQGNNTYGIMLNRSESSSLTTDPPSQDFMIDHNVVRDVPLWMCLNLHGARNVTFSANTTSGCPRAIFIAGSPMGSGVTQSANVTVTGNRLEPPKTKPGGTTDIEGVLIASLQGGLITNNAISTSYTPPVFDYQGASVNITISGTTRF